MMTIAQIMEKMIAFSEGNIHDITHLSCVWTYAKTIGELEGLDAETQFILEVAAITHDIALADAFGCGVNDLPLSMVLSWYEQKAVCILLTLLYLGIKNIRLGPTLPAFISPNILNFLVENYGIAPITTPEEDLKALLK